MFWWLQFITFDSWEGEEMIMVTHQLSSFLTKTSRFIICPPFWSAFTKLWSMQVESIVTVILGVSSKLFLRVNHHKSICRVSKSSTGSFLCGVGRRMEAILTLYCLHGGMSFISIVCICTLLAASYVPLQIGGSGVHWPSWHVLTLQPICSKESLHL